MKPPNTALSRRRFLTISAAALATPAASGPPPLRWQGLALGAEVSLSLHAPREQAQTALRVTRDRLREVEQMFSLYDPASTLSALNRNGALDAPPPLFRDLVTACDRMVAATGGAFDPTVQTLWRALALATDTETARADIGWERIDARASMRLAPHQQLTFNGIAQGFATDLIRADLAALGLTRALINIGEFAALGGPFTLGLSDPEQGIFATRRLTNQAIATSSPGAMRVADHPHILHRDPTRLPRWSSVSVISPSAAVADAASTAFTLMTRTEIARSLGRLPKGTSATLLAENGDLVTL